MKKYLFFFVSIAILNTTTILGQGGGTGFALSENGYVITNHHVIDNAKSVKIRGINGDFKKSYEAEVLKFDTINDVAILKIVDKSVVIKNIPYTFRSKDVKLGESVFVMGYPLFTTLGDNIRVTTGIISSISGFNFRKISRTWYSKNAEDFNSFLITVPLNPGNSGGPLFDNEGNVIGIVNARLAFPDDEDIEKERRMPLPIQNVGNAIRLSAFQGLLEQFSDLKLPEHNTIRTKLFTEKLQSLKHFVYIIEVEHAIDEFAFLDDYDDAESEKKIDTADVIEDILYEYEDFKTITDNYVRRICPNLISTDPIYYIVNQPVTGKFKKITTSRYEYSAAFGKFNRDVSKEVIVEYFDQNQNLEKVEIYNMYGTLDRKGEFKYKNNVLQSIELYDIDYSKKAKHYGSVILERDNNSNIISIKSWYFDKNYEYADYDEDYNRYSKFFDFSKGILCYEMYFEYDNQNKVISIALSPDNKFPFSYKNNSVTWSYDDEPVYIITYNNSQKIIEYESKEEHYKFTYQGNNLSSAICQYNEYYTSKTLNYEYKVYDAQNNPQQIDEIDPEGIEETVPFYYSYTYDSNKNCTKVIRNRGKNEISEETVEIEREIEYYQ